MKKKEASLKHKLRALKETRTDLLSKRSECQKKEDDPLRVADSMQISNGLDDIEDELQLVAKEMKRIQYRLKNGLWLDS